MAGLLLQVGFPLEFRLDFSALISVSGSWYDAGVPLIFIFCQLCIRQIKDNADCKCSGNCGPQAACSTDPRMGNWPAGMWQRLALMSPSGPFFWQLQLLGRLAKGVPPPPIGSRTWVLFIFMWQCKVSALELDSTPYTMGSYPGMCIKISEL